MSQVIAICTSKEKGTAKKMIDVANFIKDFGIEGDAHAGKWHRQVSLLALEKIEWFNSQGANVDFGAFGENLVVSGIELPKLPIGQKLRIGEVVLEITQIGKECHNKCAIYYQVGQCIMPTNGVFTKVLKGGQVKVGDVCELIELEIKVLSLDNRKVL